MLSKIRKIWGSKNSFTLIELLVVIAVIAMLASLLLPALGKAREMGRRIKCMNNLKQISQAALYYVNDYDGYFPLTLRSYSPDQFHRGIGPYLYPGRSPVHATYRSEPDYKIPYKVWNCPSAKCIYAEYGHNVHIGEGEYLLTETQQESSCLWIMSMAIALEDLALKEAFHHYRLILPYSTIILEEQGLILGEEQTLHFWMGMLSSGISVNFVAV